MRTPGSQLHRLSVCSHNAAALLCGDPINDPAVVEYTLLQLKQIHNQSNHAYKLFVFIIVFTQDGVVSGLIQNNLCYIIIISSRSFTRAPGSVAAGLTESISPATSWISLASMARSLARS